MVIDTPAFTLLTKVFDARHTVILKDWLEFLTVAPKELVVYLPENPDIYHAVDQLCQEYQILWKPIYIAPGEDVKNNETDVLLRMVKRVNSEYLLLINLDTLPYRDRAETNWLQEVFTQLQQNQQLVFFSGCGLVFRGDKAKSKNYLQTQRFSNNFGLIRKDFWLAAIANHSVDHIREAGADRFHSEWALEEEFQQKNVYGLRRIETLDWRVFHVQQWGDRLFETRDLFHRGVRVEQYLNRVHEDCVSSWDYYYNFPKPPLLHRIRVWTGKYRRLVLNQIKYQLAKPAISA